MIRLLHNASDVLRSALARAEGQAPAEYAVILALVSIVTLGTISTTGSSVRAVIGTISGSVSGAHVGTTTTGQTTTPAPPMGKKKKKG